MILWLAMICGYCIRTYHVQEIVEVNGMDYFLDWWVLTAFESARSYFIPKSYVHCMFIHTFFV